jgi:putative transcriptional regulator
LAAAPKRTMKAFDEMRPTSVERLSPEQIRQIRIREKASQAVFARYLNVTAGLVSQRERGKKRPRGASLKVLRLVAKKALQAVARRQKMEGKSGRNPSSSERPK